MSRYTPAARALLAEEGKARPDGSYPIVKAKDVEDAVADFDRSGGSAEDKAHIIARAKAVPDGTDKLPADWAGSTRLQESARALEEADIPTVGGGLLARLQIREALAARAIASIPTLDGAALTTPVQGFADGRADAQAAARVIASIPTVDGGPLTPARIPQSFGERVEAPADRHAAARALAAIPTVGGGTLAAPAGGAPQHMRFHEGTYQAGQDHTVYFQDQQTLADAAHLYALLHEQADTGSPNLENDLVRGFVQQLQSGQTLSGPQLAKLLELLDKYSDELAAFRTDPDNSQDIMAVPDGNSARILS